MFAALLDKLTEQRDLTTAESACAMREIMHGRAAPAHIAGLLVGLAVKGERPAEIVGFAQAMREEAIDLRGWPPPLLDLCGTGGDRAGTFNISSVAAIVAASCGVRVAKHGNRSVSSTSGSADLFEALGVRTTCSAATAERCLNEVGISFLFAPVFHPSMRHASAVRRDLGIPTAFNLLGPLSNPARPTHQLVGVPRPELTELLARALLLLGCERGWVVHGADGIDEISTTGYTKVSECRDGSVRTFYLHPLDVGLSKAQPGALKGGDPQANAAIARAILAGRPGPARDIVLFNAGAALFVSAAVASVEEGIARAALAIDRGDAERTLAGMVAVTNADDGGGA